MVARMAAPRPSTAPELLEDRRGALRHPVEMAGAIVTAGSGERPVTLTDISERGCQIVRLPELVGGELISLSFGGFAPIHGSVVWISAEAAGVRFDYPVHKALIAQVVAAARGRKRQRKALAPELVRRQEREKLWHLRLPVAFTMGAGGDGPGIPGILSDLSTEGCRVLAMATPVHVSAVTILIDGLGSIPGQVRWRVGDALGVQFDEALPQSDVAALVERARTSD